MTLAVLLWIPIATKEEAKGDPEVNGQMLLKNSKIFCQYSLNDLERAHYLQWNNWIENTYGS